MVGPRAVEPPARAAQVTGAKPAEVANERALCLKVSHLG